MANPALLTQLDWTGSVADVLKKGLVQWEVLIDVPHMFLSQEIICVSMAR